MTKKKNENFVLKIVTINFIGCERKCLMKIILKFNNLEEPYSSKNSISSHNDIQYSLKKLQWVDYIDIDQYLSLLKYAIIHLILKHKNKWTLNEFCKLKRLSFFADRERILFNFTNNLLLSVICSQTNARIMNKLLYLNA